MIKWKCIEDFFMESGEKAFTLYKIYEEIHRDHHIIENDEWIDVFLIDDAGQRHGMDLVTDMSKYFILVED